MFQLNLSLFAPAKKRLESIRPARSAPAPLVFTWKHDLVVHLVPSPRARRYLLRLRPDGDIRLVIPRRGSRAEALRFLERSEAWVLKRHGQWVLQDRHRRPWQEGSFFLFRGEEVQLRAVPKAEGLRLSFADQVIEKVVPSSDYRPAVLAHLRKLAHRELPDRTWELAAEHAITIHRVTVRDQKSRWGSCSSRGTISLNWRIVQAPPLVRDYLLVHELMHRKEMNHSPRYWKRVAEAFPAYREAEAWLKGTRLESLG